MKRIEVVITPSSLDTFKRVASELGIAEFDIVEVYRSGCATIASRQRLYMGREFVADLMPCLKLEFATFDEDVAATLRRLLDLVRPHSIAVLKLDQTHRLAEGQLTSSPPLDHLMKQPTEAAVCQSLGFVPRTGGGDSDNRVDVPLPYATDHRDHGRNGHKA